MDYPAYKYVKFHAAIVSQRTSRWDHVKLEEGVETAMIDLHAFMGGVRSFGLWPMQNQNSEKYYLNVL